MYTYPQRSDELMHYGIKGMHWGIRRYQNYDGTLKHPKGENKRQSSNSNDSTTTVKKKNVRKMSDDELRAEINKIKQQNERKNLEREYEELTKNPPTAKELKSKARQDAAAKLISKFADKTVNTLIDTAAKSIGDKLAKKLSDYVMPTENKKEDKTKTNTDVDPSELTDAELKKVSKRINDENTVTEYNKKKKKK